MGQGRFCQGKASFKDLLFHDYNYEYWKLIIGFLLQTNHFIIFTPYYHFIIFTLYLIFRCKIMFLCSYVYVCVQQRIWICMCILECILDVYITERKQLFVTVQTKRKKNGIKSESFSLLQSISWFREPGWRCSRRDPRLVSSLEHN